MKLKLFIFTALAILFLPVSVHASSFSLRVGQPKTPTNQNNVTLTFTASDTRDDRDITVQCFVTPPGGSESLFKTEVVTTPYGDSGTCSTGFTNTGTYTFRVVGSAPESDSIEKTITVDYNTSGPSTPVSYSKERINSCDYKIKFKTANDGKTTKVQLFRSDTLNISVGSSSVLTQQNIGPGQEGEFVNSVPVCGKDYYYVIRAVDSADNVSGTIGDSFTTTTTITSSTTTTQTEGSAGSIGGSALVVDGTGSQVTEPDSEDGTPSDAEQAGEVIDASTPSAEVLGADTDAQDSKWKWLWIPVIAIVFYFLNRYFGKKKK